MASRRYRKPIVTFEHGTRIYAPSEGEPRYRLIAKDADGARVFQKFHTEDDARRRAREVESMLASSVTMPGRLRAPATVGGFSATGHAFARQLGPLRRAPGVPAAHVGAAGPR